MTTAGNKAAPVFGIAAEFSCARDLYHAAEKDPALADAIARATRDIDDRLALFGFPGGLQLQAAERLGLRFADSAPLTWLECGHD